MDLYLLYRKAKNKYIHLIFTPINKVKFKLHRASYGKKFKTRGCIHIMRHYADTSLKIGNRVTINSAGWANPIGCGDKTYFQLLRGGNITIGNYCGISNAALTSAAGITLGDRVMLGSGCRIYDTDFHPVDYKDRMRGDQQASTKSAPIVIEDDVFIGAGSIILKGVRIGRGSVVGAGSVVAKDIPAGEIWAGNPARFIKKL